MIESCGYGSSLTLLRRDRGEGQLADLLASLFFSALRTSRNRMLRRSRRCLSCGAEREKSLALKRNFPFIFVRPGGSESVGQRTKPASEMAAVS